MGLQDRLAAFRATTAHPARPPSTLGSYDPDAEVPADADALEAACAALPDLHRVHTPAGPALVRTTLMVPERAGHRDALRRLAAGSTRHLHPLATDDPPDVPWTDSLVLDLETTSGAGGTGTGIVVLGVGRPVAEGLLVAQALVTGPHREPAALAWLTGWAAGAGAIATWNGATFDVPVLQARATLARQDLPLLDATHLDLLPIARRVWRHDLPSRRLVEVERAILGLDRPDDLPGALIPALYQDVLATRQWRRLDPVLRHNADDLLGLALAATELLRIARGAPATSGERLALAQAWERRDDRTQARRWFLAAVPPAATGPLDPAGEAALWHSARFLRRQDGPAAALPLLERLARDGTARRDHAVLQLASLAEWDLKDLDRALAHTRDLLLQPARPGRAALEHRHQRLLRRTGHPAPADPPAPSPAPAPPNPGANPAPLWIQRLQQRQRQAIRSSPRSPSSGPGNCGTVE